MTQPAHLSDEQMTRYSKMELTPVELLDLDTHLSVCAGCRHRLFAVNRSTAPIRRLRGEYSAHLDYAGLAACSQGAGNRKQLQHIAECPSCQAEVLDLSRFRTELADTPRRPVVVRFKPLVRFQIPLAVAASVLVVAGGVSLLFRRDKTPRQPAPPPVQHAEAAIPKVEREILERAMTSGQLERAPILDSLITRRGTLLGGVQAGERIDLLTPVGTTVMSDRPILRWTGLSSATSYVVSIFNEKFQKIVESPVLTSTEWQPPEALARGVNFNWQVIARTRTGTLRAPAPPAPEARFRVVDVGVAERIAAIRRDFPGQPLLLAALYAHEGALDDAQIILGALDYLTAQKYLEALQKIRYPD